MAVFKVETKNRVDIDKKPRVYFTCHPDDFEGYFNKICEDIFKTRDCAIYYTEDMTTVIADDEKQADLGRNNLFVIPVTFKLLTTPNRAMDEDIPYALKEHIPVLPIMMEAGIDEFYSQANKFGELQYLNPYSTDPTEISYEEKLKKYLESVLISDELAKRVRAAFDAYIFLSYRKKDRKYANELMRIIHSNPECRDIAIWFDEFLSPGESFKESIESILDDCKLFTLLVTPQLLEKVIDKDGNEHDNYVISTELPLARKKQQEKGTDIFAVEMVDTDKKALSAINIKDYVNPSDSEFRIRLLNTISRMAITPDNTPEHKFLIGLAYLEGIDVEVNRELAFLLITEAAEAGLIEAAEKLYKMYSEGKGVNVDYQKAIKLAEQIAIYYAKEVGPKTLSALSNFAEELVNIGNHHDALRLHENIYKLSCEIFGNSHYITESACNNLAFSYENVGEYHKAIELLENAYALSSEIQGINHSSTLALRDRLALAYSKSGNHYKALEMQKRLYTLKCEILGEDHPDTLLLLANMATTYEGLGDYHKAVDISEKVYTLRCEIYGDEDRSTVTSLNNMAYYYIKLENYHTAVELLKKVYETRCKIFGYEHPDTLITLNSLSYSYAKLGDYQNATTIMEKAYIYSCKIYGEEHLNTLTQLKALAVSYRKNNAHHKAIELSKKLYTLNSKILGEDAPETLSSLMYMVDSYMELRDYNKAAEVFEKIYILNSQKLGEDNVETLMSLECLANAYMELGAYDKAAEAQEKVYALNCKIRGKNDPETLSSLECLAISYLKLGLPDKIAEVQEKIYVLSCKIRGEDHLDTLMSLKCLASAYMELGAYDKAAEAQEKIYALDSKI